VRDWNVVVTLLPEGFRDAIDLLSRFGEVTATHYFGVLVMRVADTRAFLEALRDLLDVDARLANAVARIVPVTEKFSYESAAEFRTKARAALEPWVAVLAGRRFHVRMHRRGFKGEIASGAEERSLGEFLLERIRAAGAHAHVAFEHPDVVIAVETVDHEAGLALFTRADLARYELLRIG
jgi:tRNA(Ser,Leu) C12 N-acetylase TAN1